MHCVKMKKPSLKDHTFTDVFSFYLIQSAITKFLLKKTHKVLTDRADVRYCENQVFL